MAKILADWLGFFALVILGRGPSWRTYRRQTQRSGWAVRGACFAVKASRGRWLHRRPRDLLVSFRFLMFCAPWLSSHFLLKPASDSSQPSSRAAIAGHSTAAFVFCSAPIVDFFRFSERCAVFRSHVSRHAAASAAKRKVDAMKSDHRVVAALVAGVAIGGGVIQGLHAQAKPPVYVVVDISDVTDPAGFKAIIPKSAPETLAPFGGKYIIRTEKITPLDGIAPKRFVVIKFDSAEKAMAWKASASSKDVDVIRHKTTKSSQFLVGGM
jgi:uncharacterized protein (DUF1330 family)